MIEKINWVDVTVEDVAPGMQRQMVWGEHVMTCRLRFDDGFVVPVHSHHNEQVSTVTKGTIRFWLGEEQDQMIELHAGESMVIPPHLPHSALIIGEVEAMDIFSPPRQDWIDGIDDYLKGG